MQLNPITIKISHILDENLARLFCNRSTLLRHSEELPNLYVFCKGGTATDKLTSYPIRRPAICAGPLSAAHDLLRTAECRRKSTLDPNGLPQSRPPLNRRSAIDCPSLK